MTADLRDPSAGAWIRIISVEIKQVAG